MTTVEIMRLRTSLDEMCRPDGWWWTCEPGAYGDFHLSVRCGVITLFDETYDNPCGGQVDAFTYLHAVVVAMPRLPRYVEGGDKRTPPEHYKADQPDPAKKHDLGKPPLNLIPGGPLNQIAMVLAHGAQKYGAYNWREGFHWGRLTSAALRHIHAWNDGEDLDPETGLSHLAHASCCLLFLLEHQAEGLGTDDRETP